MIYGNMGWETKLSPKCGLGVVTLVPAALASIRATVHYVCQLPPGHAGDHRDHDVTWDEDWIPRRES